jgi:hypothetical protein
MLTKFAYQQYHGLPPTGSRGAETRGLGDWPPLRRSGPEPGSYDMPYTEGLGVFGTLSRNEKSLLLLGAAGVAAWFFFIRKPKRKKR